MLQLHMEFLMNRMDYKIQPKLSFIMNSSVLFSSDFHPNLQK